MHTVNYIVISVISRINKAHLKKEDIKNVPYFGSLLHYFEINITKIAAANPKQSWLTYKWRLWKLPFSLFAYNQMERSRRALTSCDTNNGILILQMEFK